MSEGMKRTMELMHYSNMMGMLNDARTIINAV